MDKRPPNCELQSVEVIEIFDPANANASFEFLDQNVVQLEPNSLKARQVIVRLPGCVLIAYTTNVLVRTRPQLAPEFLAYITFGPNASGTANGLAIRHNVMLAVPPGTELSVVAEPGYESMSFLIAPELLDSFCQRPGVRPPPARNITLERLYIGSGLAGQLFDWGQRLLDIAASEPEVFQASPERKLMARDELLDVIFSALCLSSPMELERRERTCQGYSEIVRAAEHQALKHSDGRPYVRDLCDAAGVSERTLENAFRTVMGLSPTAYLTKIRLHKVHEALQRAGAQTTVTDEALRWGFWHFGEFSRAYKACFHQLPSDTLKQASIGRSPD